MRINMMKDVKINTKSYNHLKNIFWKNDNNNNNDNNTIV